MKDKTAAERNQRHRENMRKQGFTLFQTWVKPEWIPKLKKLIERLAYPEKKERR